MCITSCLRSRSQRRISDELELLLVITWVPQTELKSTARAARAFNHQTILPDLYLSFVFVYFLVNPFRSLQIKPLISFWQKTQNINKKIFYLERLLKDPLPFPQGLLLFCFRRRPFASITF